MQIFLTNIHENVQSRAISLFVSYLKRDQHEIHLSFINLLNVYVVIKASYLIVSTFRELHFTSPASQTGKCLK